MESQIGNTWPPSCGTFNSCLFRLLESESQEGSKRVHQKSLRSLPHRNPIDESLHDIPIEKLCRCPLKNLRGLTFRKRKLIMMLKTHTDLASTPADQQMTLDSSNCLVEAKAHGRPQVRGTKIECHPPVTLHHFHCIFSFIEISSPTIVPHTTNPRIQTCTYLEV